jgi:hypothetical protein
LTSLAKPTQFAVRSEGEVVVLRIGNTDIRMDYETAMTLSTWMRVRSKEAKRVAGDNSRKWNVVGKLSLIEAEGRPW